MKSEKTVKNKSFQFALQIMEVCQYLRNERKHFILSNQLIRYGTSIGAMIREAEHAESRADFIHKMAITQKEANEAAYWLELLDAS